MAAFGVQEEGGGVWRITAGQFSSNSYVCEADVPGGCVLIDTGLDASAIDEFLVARGFAPQTVFCTHGHFDHAGSAAYFQRKYGAEIVLHAADLKTLKSSNFLLMAFKIPARVDLPERITLVEGGDFARPVGSSTARFHPAPGHTPGSCVIQMGERLFTGDTIYGQGVGLSRLRGEDHDQLRRSILKLWPLLDDRAVIHPGHGPSASASAVRTGNQALLRFVGLAEEQEMGAP